MTKVPLPIAITSVALALGLIFNYFFYGHAWGISAPLFLAAAILAVFLIAHLVKKRLPRGLVWPLLGSLAFGAFICIRASDFMTFWNFILAVIFLAIFVQRAAGWPNLKFTLLQPLAWFFRPFVWLFEGIVFLVRDLHQPGDRPTQRHMKEVLRGVMIALPFLVVFAALFAGADQIFDELIRDLIQIELSFDHVAQTIVTVLATLVAAGALRTVFLKTPSEARPALASKVTVKPLESNVLLSLVNVLFFVFVAIQIYYLFGGNAISQPDFNYADYARRGFFELIGVGAVAFLLIYLTLGWSRTESNNAVPRITSILATLMIVQAFVILASATQRLWLYIDAFGLTTSRWEAAGWILLLAITFAFTTYVIAFGRSLEQLMKFILLTFVVFLAAQNLLNPDLRIARANLSRFATTGKLDVEYLASGLSSDAVPELMKFIQEDNGKAKELAGQLAYELDAFESNWPYRDDWPAYHLSRAAAKRLLRQHAALLKEHRPSDQSQVMTLPVEAPIQLPTP